MLSCQRDRFSLPAGVHYLNGAYMSPLPARVEAAGQEGMARKRLPTTIRPEDFFAESDAARKRFAELVHAPDASRVAIMPAVSYGIATVAQNLPMETGETILMVEEQFPSNVYAWQRRAQETGAQVHAVEAPSTWEGRSTRWNQRILEAIDAETAVVTLPHVHWADGTRFDLEAIGERAREVGAALVVDGTQSVGALPFDVGTIQPDALVCATYKWLLGPYGLAFAYLGPRFDDGVPLEETWIGRRGSEDFQGLTEYTSAYQSGVARYDMGERSNPILLPMAIAGLDLLLEWTPEAIQAYCRGLVEDMLKEARALGYTVEDRLGRGAHLFGLRLPEGVSQEALGELLDAHDVVVSLRGDAVRVSPHVYNEMSDVEALLHALRTAAPSTP
jgi:selenocysteine lyase/cysteine desulfurase